jgi:hypothetical protein
MHVIKRPFWERHQLGVEEPMDTIEMSIELLVQIQAGMIADHQIGTYARVFIAADADHPERVGLWQPTGYGMNVDMAPGIEGRYVVTFRKI